MWVEGEDDDVVVEFLLLEFVAAAALAEFSLLDELRSEVVDAFDI